LAEHCNREFDPLSALSNTGRQEEGAQVLLHSSRADVQLTRDFFVAATLDEKIQHFLVAGRHFHLVETDHSLPLLTPKGHIVFPESTIFAICSMCHHP